MEDRTDIKNFKKLGDIKVLYPKGKYITTKRERILQEIIWLIQELTGEEVKVVFWNKDRESEGKSYNIVFRF